MSGWQSATHDEITEEIRQYLARLSGLPEVSDDMPLISGRVLDSLAAVQIVVYVERTFGIEIADEDLELVNFDTVNGLVALVHRNLERV
ncbi:acyl carrier protein [Streptomyces winkii]|uniref:acyl carrier protein n=1 Tax=Streptomyces winkii TaxID=3051178 RepID=UPI0028D657D8|nr:acyl carrier protein [Streptomyces sp. DSM 40971]